MHIMHIVGNFGPGGAEMGVVRLIRALSHRPFRHSVCSISPDLRMKHHLPADVQCYTLGIDGGSIFAFKPLASVFKTAQVGIAHVNNLAPWFDAALASRISGCHCIQTFHGVEDNTIRFSYAKRVQFFLSLSMTDCLTSVSDASAELFSQLTKIKKNKIKIIENGIDTDLFSPVGELEKKKIRNVLGLPENKIIFGCVAALRAVKNHQGLLHAFHKVCQDRKNGILVLVGDGPLEKELKNLSQTLELEDHVIFTGRQDNIETYLKAFDCFVLNSKTEGLSYAVLEAMSSGLPILATDVGGNTQIIEHQKSGILYAEGNQEQLSGAMADLLQTPEKIEAMGGAAREKIVKSYALTTMTKQYDTLYKGLQ